MKKKCGSRLVICAGKKKEDEKKRICDWFKPKNGVMSSL